MYGMLLSHDWFPLSRRQGGVFKERAFRLDRTLRRASAWGLRLCDWKCMDRLCPRWWRAYPLWRLDYSRPAG